MSFYPFVRPALFALDPETAHRLTFRALDTLHRVGLAGLIRQSIPNDPRQAMSIRFPNPVGLAAGLDKDGRHIDALGDLGFGFLEIGTVTPRPQSGNPRPRMFRLPEANALINRMGFNNDGVHALVQRVRASRFYKRGGVLGINIGKNATTPLEQSADDYVECLKHVHAIASYVTVNISSPNTKNLRQLQSADELDALLARLVAERARLADRDGRRVPLAVKIAPDLDDAQIDAIADLLIRHNIDAVIATNTTLSRTAVQGLRHAEQAGGLSGAPVRDASNRVIAALAERLRGALPIIGVGGIQSGADARAKIDAGASLVQLYTGLIYCGPSLIADCAAALRQA